MYMHACMYAYIHTHTCTRSHVQVSMEIIDTRTYAQMHTHKHTQTHTNTHTHIHTQTHKHTGKHTDEANQAWRWTCSSQRSSEKTHEHSKRDARTKHGARLVPRSGLQVRDARPHRSPCPPNRALVCPVCVCVCVCVCVRARAHAFA